MKNVFMDGKCDEAVAIIYVVKVVKNSQKNSEALAMESW
jgi:hypothetical protein